MRLSTANSCGCVKSLCLGSLEVRLSETYPRACDHS